MLHHVLDKPDELPVSDPQRKSKHFPVVDVMSLIHDESHDFSAVQKAVHLFIDSIR